MQVATRVLTSCNRLVTAGIRQCSHGLRQLVDDKSVPSCQQACCKLFQQVVTSLQKQVATSLILTDLLQLDKIDKFAATCWQVATRQ